MNKPLSPSAVGFSAYLKYICGRDIFAGTPLSFSNSLLSLSNLLRIHPHPNQPTFDVSKSMDLTQKNEHSTNVSFEQALPKTLAAAMDALVTSSR